MEQQYIGGFIGISVTLRTCNYADVFFKDVQQTSEMIFLF